MGIVLSFARQVVQFLTGDLSGRRKLDPIAVLLGDRRLPFRSVLAGSLLSAITTLHILGEVGSSLRLLRFATALGMTRPLPGCTRLGTPALMPPPRAPAGPARRSTPADGSLSTDASVRPSARRPTTGTSPGWCETGAVRSLNSGTGTVLSAVTTRNS